jgi:hypothetical protein
MMVAQTMMEAGEGDWGWDWRVVARDHVPALEK